MRTLLNISLGLILAAGMTGTAVAQGRVATLELSKVIDGYWKSKQAKAALDDRYAELDKEHKALVNDRNKLTETYTNLLASSYEQAISAEERDKRKKNAEVKLKEIKDIEENIAGFDRSARETLDQLHRRMREGLLEDVRRTVNSKAKVAGYALVLDTTADPVKGTSVVLFNNGDNDITQAILDQLNVDAPAESAKPAPKAADAKPADAKKEGKK